MSEKGATIAGLKMANAFVLTTRGVPQLYYGDEIGMKGADEPTTRADFPGGFPGDRRNAFTSRGRIREEEDLFQFIRKLTALRAELEPLRRGRLINLFSSAQQYVYARATNAQTVIVAFNNDLNPAVIKVEASQTQLRKEATLVDRLGLTAVVRVADGSFTLNLPAHSVAILVPR